MTEQEGRELAEAFVAAKNAKDVKGTLALCADDIEYAGILVFKLTGDQTGTLAGKDSVGRFLTKLYDQADDGSQMRVGRLGIGTRSVVFETTVWGMIQVFVVLVANPQGKISKVLVHQEVR